jgi:hypothetical protein
MIVSLINSGAILDQRRWIFFLEYLRALIVMIEIRVVFKTTGLQAVWRPCFLL